MKKNSEFSTEFQLKDNRSQIAVFSSKIISICTSRLYLILILIGIVLAILVLVGFAFLFLGKYFSTPQITYLFESTPNPVPSPIATVTTTPENPRKTNVSQVAPMQQTTEAITNWQNVSLNGIKLQIPPDWKYDSCNRNNILYIGPPEFDPSSCPPDGPAGIISILWRESVETRKLPESEPGIIEVDNRTEMVINGVSAVKQEVEIFEGPLTGKTLEVYINNKNNVSYTIKLYAIEYTDIFKQVLSTFQILD